MRSAKGADARHQTVKELIDPSGGPPSAQPVGGVVRDFTCAAAVLCEFPKTPDGQSPRSWRPALRDVLIAVCCFLLPAGVAAAQTKLAGSFPPSGYRLQWFDKFDGTSLDLSKWMYRTDVKASSSQIRQNVELHDGNLVLWMRKQEDRGKQYTGGGIISRQRFHYGYFEARTKLFGGAGWHESIWAMAAGDGSTTYPPNIRTEIDGLEFDSDTPWKGRMGLIIWQGPSHSENRSCTAGVRRGPLGVDATTAFHTYGFEYTENAVKFYLDGDLRCVLNYPPADGEHDAINFWLTAIGYEMHGVKIHEPELPGKMLVDFAAFYESGTSH